ncbi:MAG: murein L,D-transpeptidase catalytic domain-containing protein [Sphingorhabdus sp.]
MRRRTRFGITLAAFGAAMFVLAFPASAQPDIVFVPGDGSGQATDPRTAPRPMMVSYPLLSCANLTSARERLAAQYGNHSGSVTAPALAESPTAISTGPDRLDKTLLDTALDSYDSHICAKYQAGGFGPSVIVIVDYAKSSSEPRLYAVNLLSGQGLDTPVAVAHGIGSDRNDDGTAESFSNVYNSLASSLGAARGGELYTGINGLSLRLDGLDASNSGMRVRDIVAHSYPPERRRYFNASLVQVRGGKPGLSEGCFVVAPHLRDWLFSILRDGGFLFAGLGGDRAKEMPVNAPRTDAIMGDVVFVPGTGG